MNIEVSSPPEKTNQLLGLKAVESPDRGVLCLDDTGTVQFANPRVAEMFGLSVCEIVGQPYAALIQKLMDGFSDPDRFRSRSMELLTDGSAVGEDVFERSDSETVLHRYSTRVLGNDGRPQGRVEIYSDITFRRRLEREIVDRNSELARLNEELRTAQEQLVQSEKLRVLGEMAAGVAHDLNNVLGAVLANVQLLMKSKESEPLKDGLESIELAALDGAETVRRIRELAKVGAENAFVPTELSEIVNDVLRVMQPTWQTEDSGPEVQIVTELDNTPGVLGNPPELREALANMVLNAVQAMPDGGQITLSTGIDRKGAFLAIKDDGIGMSEDTKKRLFDPFFTTRGAEGTGLGMSIVYAIVTRHGGHIDVESEEGKGTEIRIVLPANGPVLVETPVTGSEPDIKALRVLVAHTDEVMGTIVSEMLTEAGHEGQVVTNPLVLHSCGAEEEFDVILVDESLMCDIPDSLRRQAPVVVMCSPGFVGNTSENESGDILMKPVKMDDLIAVTRKLAHSR